MSSLNLLLIVIGVLLIISPTLAKEVVIVGDMFYEAKTQYKECENIECCETWYRTLATYIVCHPIVTRVETTSSNPAWPDYPKKITCCATELVKDGKKSYDPDNF